MPLIPLCGVGFYNLIEHQIRKNNSMKLTANYLSSLHLLIVLCINVLIRNESTLLNNILVMNTTGYFFNDLLYILKYKKLKITNLVYLYHHITVGLFMIYKSENSYFTTILFLGEISNIPTNIIYHLIHSDGLPDNLKLKNICEYFQLYVYTFIRIFCMSYLSYYEYYLEKDSMHTIIYYLIQPILLMGYIYSIILFKNKYINEEKKKQ